MRVRVASAGTGKTTSLVRRYLELVDTGTPLRRIAGVTYTRSAAAELRERVGAGLREALEAGAYLGGVYVPQGPRERLEAARRELGGALLKTIHGFMIAGLRLSAPLLSLDPRFALVSENEARDEFAEELASLRLLAAEEGHRLHAALLAAGEHAATLPVEVFERRSLAAELTFAPDPVSQGVGALYREAYARLVRRWAGRRLGPGEVERAALRLLDHPAACRRLVERYPVVLVDEYQDVNPLQGEFFERLEAAGAKVEVVGDPKQSIYLFRNADVNVFRRAMENGETLPPLTESRRHSRAVLALLNRFTSRLAQGERAVFRSAEAPDARGAGAQAAVEGTAELLVVAGQGRIDALRAVERELLADRLVELHERDGVPYGRMAVLARRRAQLERVRAALAARGVPAELGRRGMFKRQELADVRFALEVAHGGGREALGALLRGPLGGLTLAEVRAVLADDEPLGALRRLRPDAYAVVEELRRLSASAPLDALKAVLRGSLAGRRPLVEAMSRSARANLDAMLFAVAQHQPEDLAGLVTLLELLADRSEAEDVPVEAGGVQLLTVHSSKGLEFDVVAVYDAGYQRRFRPPAVVVEPRTGRTSLLAAVRDEAAVRVREAQEAEEDLRLLYVALSRARDRLLVTGSLAGDEPRGWLATLLSLGLERDAPLHGVRVTRVPPRRPAARLARVEAAPPAATPSGWESRAFAPHRHGPLSSPSRLVDMLRGEEGGPAAATRAGDVGAADEEPLTRFEALGLGDGLGLASAEDVVTPGERHGASVLGADLPGAGRVVGTLVHFAISQDWPADPGVVESLRAHELMFPYAPEQQDELLRDVLELLAGYHALLGAGLPALGERDEDRAELPLAYPGGPTVWEGVIDRLYRVGEQWWIDDYKTDRQVRPERYHVQLGLYRHAVRDALGVTPRARLVYLRSRTVVPLDPEVLEAALHGSGVLGRG